MMMRLANCAILSALSALAIACSPDPPAKPPPPAESISSADVHAGQPQTELPAADDKLFGGIITERSSAGPYTYVLVETLTGPRWVVTMGSAGSVGERVNVINVGTRSDFYSRRLDRRFQRVAFGIVHTHKETQ